MEFGVILPQNEIGRDPKNTVEFVRQVEDAGFGYLQIYDHVLGADPATRPGWSGGYNLYDQFHEPFVLYGYLAALTQLELVTGVIILPQRQTALVAKQAAEVDILTEGRFRLGVGIGWNAVEYEALGIDFQSRGARCEEQIEVLRRLWTEESITVQSRFHSIDHAGILPLPVQTPIPIWLGGGKAQKVLERIGRIADGWICNLPPGEELSAALDVVHRCAQEAGRSEMPGLQLAVRISQFNAAEIDRQIEASAQMGATHLSINALKPKRSLEQHLEVIRQSAEVIGDRMGTLR